MHPPTRSREKITTELPYAGIHSDPGSAGISPARKLRGPTYTGPTERSDSDPGSAAIFSDPGSAGILPARKLRGPTSILPARKLRRPVW
ncbi:MAG: hypothetical protein HY791_35310 [Deltaproteobacteria bacterium]|nr:hypothetical protein [Deltaproteobacteria bacterium]